MVTGRRDLRTGRSLWEVQRLRGVAHGPLTQDIETDVLVIGAGITGAMIAEALAARGFGVVIADKRGLAKGSTAASTALIQYEIDTPLVDLTRKIGRANAIRAWRRSRLAVDALATRLRELGPVPATERSTLFLEGNRLDAEGLLREKAARQAAGLASVFLDRTHVRSRFGISGRTALLIYGGFVVNP